MAKTGELRSFSVRRVWFGVAMILRASVMRLLRCFSEDSTKWKSHAGDMTVDMVVY